MTQRMNPKITGTESHVLTGWLRIRTANNNGQRMIEGRGDLALAVHSLTLTKTATAASPQRTSLRRITTRMVYSGPDVSERPAGKGVRGKAPYSFS
jgi:hypothetical protein